MTVKALIDKLIEMVESDEIWSKSEILCIEDVEGSISYPEEIYVNMNGMLVIKTIGDALYS